MPLLLYLVTEPETPLPGDPSGYRGASVERLFRDRLACWFSRVEAASVKQFAPADAVTIHRLSSAALDGGTAIPFRFPTLVENDAELERYLDDNGKRFAQALTRLRGFVQMEVQITAEEPRGERAPSSGRAYLAARRDREAALRAAREELTKVSAPVVLCWSDAQARHCALLRREDCEALRQAVASATLPAGIAVRVTGPWPATAFVEEPVAKEAL